MLYRARPYLYTMRCRVDVSPTDVSPTESSWMLRLWNKASLGYCAPDQCVPTLDCAMHGSYKVHCKGRAARIQYKSLVPIYVFLEMKLLFPKQNYNVLSPSSFTHISVKDLYISRIFFFFFLLNLRQPDITS